MYCNADPEAVSSSQHSEGDTGTGPTSKTSSWWKAAVLFFVWYNRL